MTHSFTRIVSLLGSLALFSATSALADDAAANHPEVRALIERQLDAFAHDDAAGAYALAAPTLKTIFSDPDIFMGMVRTRYAPVYRHRSVEFGQLDVNGDSISQIVTLVDQDNQVWKALYKLARQPDGSWLINGCLLIKSTDAST